MMMDTSGSHLMTVTEVAQVVGCSVITARSLIRNGQIRGRQVGASWKANKLDIFRYCGYSEAECRELVFGDEPEPTEAPAVETPQPKRRPGRPRPELLPDHSYLDAELQQLERGQHGEREAATDDEDF